VTRKAHSAIAAKGWRNCRQHRARLAQLQAEPRKAGAIASSTAKGWRNCRQHRARLAQLQAAIPREYSK
jgi:hypothetical protein